MQLNQIALIKKSLAINRPCKLRLNIIRYTTLFTAILLCLMALSARLAEDAFHLCHIQPAQTRPLSLNKVLATLT